jgi:hypothetical protein
VLNRTGATLSEYVVFFFYVTCALFQMASRCVVVEASRGEGEQRTTG